MFDNNNKAAKAGTFIMLSQGRHAGYRAENLVEVLRDFEPLKVQAGYLKNAEDPADFSGFKRFLVRNKFVRDVKYREWFLGSEDLSDCEIYD